MAKDEKRLRRLRPLSRGRIFIPDEWGQKILDTEVGAHAVIRSLLDALGKTSLDPSLLRVSAAKGKARAWLEANPEPTEASEPTKPLRLGYLNWRGELKNVTITPKRAWYGSTDWHTEPQWLLSAYDHTKDEMRDYAMKDFRSLVSESRVGVEIDIDDLRGIHSKATPGDWAVSFTDSGGGVRSAYRIRPRGTKKTIMTISGKSTPGKLNRVGSNADFVALAYNTFPLLLDEIEYLRKSNKNLGEELDTLESEQSGYDTQMYHDQKEAEAWKAVAKRAGVCMTCAITQPAPYGCTDCLNTGWDGGAPAKPDAPEAAPDNITPSDGLTDIALSNLRSFIRNATFKMEVDRQAANNCVDVLRDKVLALNTHVAEARALLTKLEVEHASNHVMYDGREVEAFLEKTGGRIA